MFKQDYILRMIHEITHVLLVVTGFREKGSELFDKEEQEMEQSADQMKLWDELKRLSDSGEINRAENLLYEHINMQEESNFHLALKFYTLLNTYNDHMLESADYSREEIYEGLLDCAKKFGIDNSLLESFTH